jgi:chaperone required for assembly of F1-ATPase
VRRPNGEPAKGAVHRERSGLSRRFYAAATIAAEPSLAAAERRGPVRPQGYRVLLDGRTLRTPAKRDFVVPTRGLAAAVAAEWQAQGDRIDPSSMPLTRLVNSAIDGVAARQAEVRADIVRYLASDLLCYRAAAPADLVRRQAEAWDPILDWSQAMLGKRLKVTEGVVPVPQPPEAGAALVARLARLDAFGLAAGHVLTTLLGSALLALAHLEGRLDAAAAWAAAQIDEDFQAEKWGVDREAKARRDRHWSELEAASRLLHLSRSD